MLTVVACFPKPGLGGVSLKDDRRDGQPVALLPTRWTDEASKSDLPLPEYPRPQMIRPEWLNLNGKWDYIGGPAAPSPTARPAISPEFPPNCETIKVPFPAESYLSGIMRKQEINLWYRRSFEIPLAWKGQHVLIHFGAVASHAAVFVNGKLAGQHSGAWDAFEFDVTDLLRPGSNELVVGAWDNHDGHCSCGKNCVTQGDYTTTSGIWQTVWLEPVPVVSIRRLIITPDVKHGSVKVKALLSGGSGKIKATVQIAGTDIAAVDAPSDSGIEIPLSTPHLWSLEDPFLYDLKVQLCDPAGKVIDEVGSYFGMRSVELGTINGQRRPLLNGHFVFQFGPLDQGYWPDGIYTAPTDAALRFDLATIKRLGFTLVRKHAKVEPQRWYYWADKLGLLVWQDMPSAWYPEIDPKQTHAQFEREWQTIIDQHANSPAIVAWVPFNENWGAYDVPRITEWTKQLDPTRLVDGMTGPNFAPGYRKAPGDPKNGDFTDLHIYIGPGKTPLPTATRAASLGEYGGVGLAVPDHMWPCKTGSYEMKKSVDDLTRRYEGLQADLAGKIHDRGLSAAVYTQITDVEHEVNGFLTYDRQVEKMDFARVRAANEAVMKAANVVAAEPTTQPG